RQEAIALLRYQLRALMDAGEKGEGGSDSTHSVVLSDLPSMSDRPASSTTASDRLASIVARPSVVSGGAYKQVSKAYIDAVHSVLTGHKTAAASAAELEKQLVAITGFKTGP